MPILNRAEALDLAHAKRILESPSLAVRIGEAVGVPVEALMRRLPDGAQARVEDMTRKALDGALDLALRTLAPRGAGGAASDWLHRGLVVASGALGGSVGLAGLLLELPFTLTVMMRSIAAHAAAQGEDLDQVPARLECLTVFAYGARGGTAAPDSAYFAVRAGLARAVAQAAELVGERGAAVALGDRGAPALVQLVARVAQRLGVSVTDKAAAQLVPVLGAAGGAAVNGVFIHHYQETAWAHFTVRRLERAHGKALVRQAYDAVPFAPR